MIEDILTKIDLLIITIIHIFFIRIGINTIIIKLKGYPSQNK